MIRALLPPGDTARFLKRAKVGLEAAPRQNARLMVQDTRSVLVIQLPRAMHDVETLISLQYALQRAIEEVFQLEEQELSSEVLTEQAPGRVIYWEAAEGGAGVLRRLFHNRIDRRLVCVMLINLANAQVLMQTSHAASQHPLVEVLPPATRRVLEYIHGHGGHAPDAVLPEKHGYRPHLFYAPSFYVLCLGPGEDIAAMRDDLEDAGGTVLVITSDQDIDVQLSRAHFYDLPWNPNRLEQREGRVDRYGQPSKQVRTVLMYGQDNPIDEAVIKVLLRKAASIHRTLGISVPLPLDSGTVVETLIAALFTPAPRQVSMFDDFEQMTLPDADQGLDRVEQAWNRAVEREKASRTRFAQRRIKPEEVARELEETDAVLGDQAAVERFVRAACERLGAPLTAERGHLLLATGLLPQLIGERIGSLLPQGRKGRDQMQLPLTFDDTAPQGIERVGRNHPLTTALAEYLLELALTPEANTALATRCGLIRTHAVAKRTVLLLLRVRMRIKSAKQEIPGLAEELVLCGYTRSAGAMQWLDEAAALVLLQQAKPAANVTPDERTLGLQSALTHLDSLTDELNTIAHNRAARLRELHGCIRAAVGGGQTTVTPRIPPDVLGVYVLQPAL